MQAFRVNWIYCSSISNSIILYQLEYNKTSVTLFNNASSIYNDHHHHVLLREINWNSQWTQTTKNSNVSKWQRHLKLCKIYSVDICMFSFYIIWYYGYKPSHEYSVLILSNFFTSACFNALFCNQCNLFCFFVFTGRSKHYLISL